MTAATCHARIADPVAPSGLRAVRAVTSPYTRRRGRPALPPRSAACTTLARALDVEGKIPRALESLGPIGGRDVVARRRRRGGVAAPRGARGAADRGRSAAGRRRRRLAAAGRLGRRVVASWSAFRGVDPRELAEADRVLRPDGRLLVIHDYGRDDVSRLRGDLPEYRRWSRRDGPFLPAGFRIRVIHCFWTFDSLDGARGLPAGGVRRRRRQRSAASSSGRGCPTTSRSTTAAEARGASSGLSRARRSPVSAAAVAPPSDRLVRGARSRRPSGRR